MQIKVLWSIPDWVDAIVALPAGGPLACRTVLVPRERVAHSLRRELLRMGRADVLAGTRFVPFLAAAVSVLQAAGMVFTSTERALRPKRLRVLLRRGIPLHYFSDELLRSAPGWDQAFARTISDLESAGLRPQDLPLSPDDPRWHDVATIWRALDESAGASWTPGRTFVEAASCVEDTPQCWPFEGPVLAIVTGDSSAAKARFIRAIPELTLGVLVGRPLREHYVERLEKLFGQPAAAAARVSSRPRRVGTERELLASFLFEPPEVLADPTRPRSGGPDGTVHLEEHAGIESEVEAAADWAARQVMERHTPLEEIAILLPVLDPLAAMLVERLQRLPWADGHLPVYVAGGLPVSRVAAGARALAVVRALQAHLAAAALADVLPALRTASGQARHLTRGRAMDLTYSLGTVGGSPARPTGALEWPSRAAKREKELEAQLIRAREAAGDQEQAGLARNARDLERLLADLRAIRPALDRLVAVASLVVNRLSLPAIWRGLRAFLEEWLPSLGEEPHVAVLLDEALRPVCDDPTCSVLAGVDALEVIDETLRALRVLGERFGYPAIYVGTVQEAVGLRFQAVRVIGLAEGSLPSAPREDPVLPEQQRAPYAGGALLSSADRTLAQLHALDQLVRDVDGSVVLSAPRFSVERTERETSSIFIEAAAALGRPDRRTKKAESVIPNANALRRDAFEPARAEMARFRIETPLSAAAWQDCVAARRREVPAAWRGAPALDLERIRALTSSEVATPLDGAIGADVATPAMPGLTPETPISASRLRRLLECPHHFVFEDVLRWQEPAAPPSLREIDPLPYGGLLHRVAEDFFRAHGAEFGQRQGTLPQWLERADAFVERAFHEFCAAYPLIGEAVRGQQRQRLRRDFRTFLEYDWNQGQPRTFVAVERPFGRPDPVRLSIGDVALYLRGFIDRIDIEGEKTLVRDLKSGRAHPRQGKESDPDPVRDVQIAVYGTVVRQLAAEWNLPATVAAAYAYTDWREDPEREFREDFSTIEAAAQRWLGTAGHLLAGRLFPRTPNADDCRFCPFRPVCGPRAYERAARLLEGAPATLADFRSLKEQA
ncbi:MAG: PD-(D/E)XK nuclease family protein [Candidatus Binatia bacterium]